LRDGDAKDLADPGPDGSAACARRCEGPGAEFVSVAIPLPARFRDGKDVGKRRHGAAPNFQLDLAKAGSETCGRALRSMRPKADRTAPIDRCGARRTSPRFRAAFDAMNAALACSRPPAPPQPRPIRPRSPQATPPAM
jgi:hypothetical protein